jgi:hypothetical protein
MLSINLTHRDKATMAASSLLASAFTSGDAAEGGAAMAGVGAHITASADCRPASFTAALLALQQQICCGTWETSVCGYMRQINSKHTHTQHDTVVTFLASLAWMKHMCRLFLKAARHSLCMLVKVLLPAT